MVENKIKVGKVIEKKKGALPVYTQLAYIIKDEIASGRLAPGIQIPSESKLAKQYDVSPMTVRQAIGVLVDEGLVKRVHGSGTFVRRIEVGSTTFGLDALDEVLSDKINVKVRILKSTIVRVNGEAREVLGLAKNASVILVERLLAYRERPFCTQIAYLPFDPKAPIVENMLETMGLSDLFFSNKNYGYKKGVLKLLPAQADERETRLLALQDQNVVFKLEYIYYDFGDKPCAYGWFIIPHEMMPLVSQVGVWND